MADLTNIYNPYSILYQIDHSIIAYTDSPEIFSFAF
jgi:hypothetical protein